MDNMVCPYCGKPIILHPEINKDLITKLKIERENDEKQGAKQ